MEIRKAIERSIQGLRWAGIRKASRCDSRPFLKSKPEVDELTAFEKEVRRKLKKHIRKEPENE